MNKMLRSTASRFTIKAFPQIQSSRINYSSASKSLKNKALARICNPRRPQVLQCCARNIPKTTTLFYVTRSDPKRASEIKLEQKTGAITAKSSVGSTDEVGTRLGDHGDHEDNPLHEIKKEFETIVDAFALRTVPKESYYLGAAGTLPYAITALTSTYLAFDANHGVQHGMGFFMPPETALQILEFITPLQIGYGAVIISFLGAIHWGLEYAGYGGHHGYRRYVYGVIAPAMAWPTIFMPVDLALISQFVSFVFLYFADARATMKGWFPPWYSAYRFVLTFVVGTSIVMTLIGRGQVASHEVSALKSPIETIKKERDNQWEEFDKEEQEKMKRFAKEETDG